MCKLFRAVLLFVTGAHLTVHTLAKVLWLLSCCKRTKFPQLTVQLLRVALQMPVQESHRFCGQVDMVCGYYEHVVTHALVVHVQPTHRATSKVMPLQYRWISEFKCCEEVDSARCRCIQFAGQHHGLGAPPICSHRPPLLAILC